MPSALAIRSACSSVLVGALLGASLAATPTVASANGSLAAPITGPSLDALWPIEIEVDIVRIDEATHTVLAPHRAKVPDGHAMTLESVVRTDSGERRFSLAVVPHHHPGGVVEVEWSLEVHQAKYRAIDAAQYLLHRLQLDDVLELEDPSLTIARADIVEIDGTVHRKEVWIGEELHEIRIFARAVRG